MKSIEEGIKIAEDIGEQELFIIGGGEIYKQSLDMSDKLYLTRIHGEFEGDTFFPVLDMNVWRETAKEECSADDKHDYAMTFLQYTKK